MSLDNGGAAPAAEPVAQPQASELQPSAPAPADGGAPQTGEGQATGEQQQSDEAAAAAQAAAERKREEKNLRFGDLTKERNKAREEAAYWRGVAEAARNGQAPKEQAAPQAPTAPKGPPDPKDYPQGQYDPRYTVDLAKHELRAEQEADRERQSTAEREAAVHREMEEGRARVESVIERAASIADENPDLAGAEGVLRLALVPLDRGGISRHTADLITTADNPLHVAEYFARKPDDLRGLRSLPPIEQAKYIGKLDAMIGANLKRAASQPAPTPKPAPTPSPAAIPTAPAAGAPLQFNADTASFAEFEQHAQRVWSGPNGRA